MTPRAALILLSLVCPLLLVLLMVPGAVPVWLVAPGICGLPVLLIVVGSGMRQPSTSGLVALWMTLTGSWLFLRWLSGATDLTHPSAVQASLVLGVMLLGLGLVPLALVGWLFGRWFTDDRLGPEDLERLREGWRP